MAGQLLSLYQRQFEKALVDAKVRADAQGKDESGAAATHAAGAAVADKANPSLSAVSLQASPQQLSDHAFDQVLDNVAHPEPAVTRTAGRSGIAPASSKPVTTAQTPETGNSQIRSAATAVTPVAARPRAEMPAASFSGDAAIAHRLLRMARDLKASDLHVKSTKPRGIARATWQRLNKRVRL
jgi:hypothetical protein